MFTKILRKITNILLTAAMTGAVSGAVSSMSAGAEDIWQSADEIGNYITDAPYGTVIGSIPENTSFITLSSVTAYDGTVWGLCGDGSYICLDYCTCIKNSSNTSVYGFMNDNQHYIYLHFINKGMPTESAAAIASNAFDESGCNADACCIDTNGLVSYGICQWNGDRNIRMADWCYANGYDYTTMDGQLAYLDYELMNDYPDVYNALMTGGDAWTLGYIWASEFEVCADYYWNVRGDNALALYNNIG